MPLRHDRRSILQAAIRFTDRQNRTSFFSGGRQSPRCPGIHRLLFILLSYLLF